VWSGAEARPCSRATAETAFARSGFENYPLRVYPERAAAHESAVMPAARVMTGRRLSPHPDAGWFMDLADREIGGFDASHR